jgi:hypothetical protein
VSDAEAFLHERLGDLDAALRLYVSTAQHATSALTQAVAAGSLPLLLLPQGYWVPGWFDRASIQSAQQQAHLHPAHSSSSSSGRDHTHTAAAAEGPCWGMEMLVRQLESVVHMMDAAGAAGTAGPSSTVGVSGGRTGSTGVPADLHQASQQLRVAAAYVAATLLHQLDPSSFSSSSSRQVDRAPAPLNSSASGGLSSSDTMGDGSSSSSASVPLQLPPPVLYLYRAWMAELSPRLRLKGLGPGLGSTAAAAGGGGAWQGGNPQGGLPSSSVWASSSGGTSSAAAAAAAAVGLQAGLQVPGVPEVLRTAWQSLQSAVAFCERNTRPSSTAAAAAAAAGSSASPERRSSSSGGPAGVGQELWFQLMEVYVANLRGLRTGGTQQSQPTQTTQQQQQLAADLLRAAAQQVPLRDLPGILRAGGAAVAAQQMLPELLRLLLDEVVCCMADHLPLLDIVGRIIQQHGTERFGEFRSTLLGLLGATGYDSAILSAANRLITGDAFSTVRHAYGLRQLARAIQEQQQQQQVEAASGVAASSSSSSLLVAPAMAAAGAVPAAAVKSAMLLGVLGSPGSYDSSSSSSSGGRLSSRYSLTQADRDLIQGILGAGGMRLQLQPAGPVGQVPGIEAAYKAAAQAVADSGRMFHAGLDLALELAMLQSLQEHQHHQRRQHGAPGDSTGCGPGSWGAHEGGAAGASSQEHQQVDSGGDGPRVTTTSSFDIDELLTWSHVNM